MFHPHHSTPRHILAYRYGVSIEASTVHNPLPSYQHQLFSHFGLKLGSSHKTPNNYSFEELETLPLDWLSDFPGFKGMFVLCPAGYIVDKHTVIRRTHIYIYRSSSSGPKNCQCFLSSPWRVQEVGWWVGDDPTNIRTTVGSYQWSRLKPSNEFHFEGLSNFSLSVEGLVQIQYINPRI